MEKSASNIVDYAIIWYSLQTKLVVQEFLVLFSVIISDNSQLMVSVHLDVYLTHNSKIWFKRHFP